MSRTTTVPSKKQAAKHAEQISNEPLRPLLVRASAGTGKTYRLTGRLMRVLLRGAPLESVLATTFTRKAAGEILDRVLVSLARAATDATGEELENLSEQVQGEPVGRQDVLRLLHTVVRDIHRLRICTLDSLFSQLARSFPYELGLPPGWRLTDEIEEAWLRERAVDTMLAGLEPQAVSALLSMLGKGEVRRSVHREMLSVINDAYADARRCDTKAWQALNVPAGPEEQAVTRAAGILLTAKIGHKSADKKLQQIGENLESRCWDALAAETPVATAGQWKAPQDLPTYYRKPLPEDVLQALQVAYEGARTEVLGLLHLQTEATGEVLEAFDRQIGQTKQAIRAVGFDDVAFRLARWMNQESSHAIGHRLDGTIDHLLLDEFQDTSPEQWSVLRPFAQHTAAGQFQTSAGQALPTNTNGLEPTFFCVGDTKQAIYGWRGGVSAIFDAVTKQIPGVRQDQQDKSYRSSPVISQTITEIFQNLTRHPGFAAEETPEDAPADRSAYESFAVRHFAKNFPKHESAHAELPGFVQLETGPCVEGPSAERNLALQVYAADRIAALAGEAPGRSFGVLTRTNATVARLIYLLRARGVEVSQEGGNPLTDSAAVEVILSAIMLAEHPGDGRWWYHVQHSPLVRHWAGNDGPLPPLSRRAAGSGGEETGEGAQENARYFLANAQLPELQHASDAVTAGAAIRQQIEDWGLVAALRKMADPLAAVCDASDSLRLRQLLQLAQAYERNPQPRLSDFVRLVREKRVERPQPAQVRVMTVHQAKGLEFDAVVLPELDGNLTRQARKCIARCPEPSAPPEAMLRYLGGPYWHFLPKTWQRTFGLHAAGLMTEALCLLYVALTRPRSALHVLITPPNKPDFKTKTASALLYHALGCTDDPTSERTVLFQRGEADWHRQTERPEPEKKVVVKPRTVRLQPLAPVPLRNRIVDT